MLAVFILLRFSAGPCEYCLILNRSVVGKKRLVDSLAAKKLTLEGLHRSTAQMSQPADGNCSSNHAVESCCPTLEKRSTSWGPESYEAVLEICFCTRFALIVFYSVPSAPSVLFFFILDADKQFWCKDGDRLQPWSSRCLIIQITSSPPDVWARFVLQSHEGFPRTHSLPTTSTLGPILSE